MSENKYVPSGSCMGSVINSLNEYLGDEFGLPGNWSPTLTYNDLKIYPCLNKRILGETMRDANNVMMKYRDFFVKTRGYERKVVNKTIWEIYDDEEDNMLMLYHEDVFLKYCDAEVGDDNVFEEMRNKKGEMKQSELK